MAAEFWALREGLQIGLNQGIVKLVMEMDAEPLMMIMNNPYATNPKLNNFINACRIIRTTKVKEACEVENTMVMTRLGKAGNQWLYFSTIWSIGKEEPNSDGDGQIHAT
ncbi:hypothetical protein RJ640_010682 [Escallonia rubra]|uniref:RNase H type-1 domain-containing protein n=1 Tax=Escallonia rubra TaxID=112253 RepID=A0AA88RQ66_9ASTE|nr:hypothetical protein RJ640_010682 [Escallonia rubra]